MRTIKFRGKRTDNGEWVYGDLIQWDNGIVEILNHGKGLPILPSTVIPETVGQFTGLFDKDGKEIYEGDILREPPKSQWDEINYSAFEVFYHDNDRCTNHVGFQMNRMHNHGNVCGGYVPCFRPEYTKQYIIIGNIHDK